MPAWRIALVLWLAACDYPPLPRLDGSINSPTSCDRACDSNATCTVMSGAAACRCNPGFSGDGTTCSDIDECAADTSGCSAACLNTPGGFTCYTPRTCGDVQATLPAASDGTYTLYLDGDPTAPWSAYCAGMVRTPREYLTLTGMNFSQYTAGGFFGGTDVRTTYSKVRFVPASHKVDISDRSFATSQGQLGHPSSTAEDLETVTSMPYGVAMDCSGERSDTGIARIDLAGTPFALIGAQQFTMNGGAPGGSVVLNSNKQQATLRGGGVCGWTAPVGAPPEPINDHVTAGVLLELVYRP